MESEENEEHALDEELARKRIWEYWTGDLDLAGRRNGADWHFTLHVSEFTSAMEEFVSDLEMSIDWNDLPQ